MIGDDLYDRLTELEHDIKSTLIDKISKYGTESMHISDVKALKVNIFNYVELLVLDRQLIFLDRIGNHYSLFNGDVEYEDLIDIIIEYENE